LVIIKKMKAAKLEFLSNQPIGEDKFEGQSQVRIAKSIADLLVSENCQMIGIDGGWGTGKSNVVKIVEKLIKSKSQEKFHFFTYDAWGHQGDLHRKEILTELISFLCVSNNILKKDVWEVKLKELLGKKVEKTIKSIPTLGGGIIVSFLTLILMPILGMYTDQDEIDIKTKISIMIIPLGLILILFIYNLIKGLIDRRRNKKRIKDIVLVAATKLIYVYKDENIERTSLEYTHEINPSVNSFRAFIKEISYALGTNRLILVFDNFDRLPVNQVKELWASIHTFFSEENDYRNISVIVPFDRDHIISAFKEENINTNSGHDQNDTRSICYGNDFINKTFDVVFRVSLPILSDWEHYFKELWRKAFGDEEVGEMELNKVVQIFDLLTKRITPREIVAFINECVSIRLALIEEVPFRYVALFVKAKDIILKSPLEEITTPSYLGPLEIVYKTDENLPKYISSLTYQVNSEKALDIVYRKELKDALENGDVEKVKAISNSSSFLLYLRLIINELINIEKTVITLNEILKIKSEKNIDVQDIWDDLLSKEHQKHLVEINLSDYKKVLLLEVSLENKKQYLKELFSGFISADNYNSITYTKNIKTLTEIMQPFEINILDYVESKKTTAADFVEYFSSGIFQVTYKIECNKEELDTYLSNQSIDKWGTINFLPHIKPYYEFPNYKSKLYEAIPVAQEHGKPLKIVLSKLKELEEQINIETITDEAIASILDDPNAPYFDLIAIRIARQNAFATAFSSGFDAILSTDDDETVEKLSEVINYYISYDDLLMGLDGFGEFALYKKLCKKLTLSHDSSLTADIVVIISNFEKICATGELNPNDLLDNLSDWELPEIKPKDVPIKLSYYLLSETISNTNKLAVYLRNQALTYLDEISEEGWQANFNKPNSYEISIAKLLGFKWNSNSINALKKVMSDIASSKKPIPEKQAWDEIINAVSSKRNLTSTFNNVTDLLCDNSNPVSIQLFKFFADWLFKYSSGFTSKQEVLRKIFPIQILTDQDCVVIILKNKDKIAQIISSSGEEASDFTDAVKEYASDGNPNMIQLAEFLRLDFSSNESQNSAD
jgi:hypothetical protein